MQKKLKKPGKNILPIAEIENISKEGLWIFIKNKEYFLPFSEYPWFKKATLEQIYNFKLIHGKYLHWPALDVDLSITSLNFPEAYPLIAK